MIKPIFYALTQVKLTIMKKIKFDALFELNNFLNGTTSEYIVYLIHI